MAEMNEGPVIGEELSALIDLVDRFSKDMRSKLIEKYMEGYTGWDNPDELEFLKDSLVSHTEKGFDSENMVDVANLAAMIWGHHYGFARKRED